MKTPDEGRNLAEETVETTQVFKGDLLGLTINKIRSSDGSIHKREVVHHPGGVVILPIVKEAEGEELLMVKQYREPAGKALWELPAGTLEQGESPEMCARRELIEETRYRPAELQKKVDLFTSPGYSNEVLTLYHATGLEKVPDSELAEPPEGENLIAKSFSVEKLLSKARKGKIRDGKTLAGLFFFVSENR